jgi:NitT/TauT family transport system permease protein
MNAPASVIFGRPKRFPTGADHCAVSVGAFRLSSRLRSAALRDRIWFGALLVTVWQAAGMVMDAYWLPPPFTTFSRIVLDLTNVSVLKHAATTLLEAQAGLVVGSLPAIGIALALRKHLFAAAVLEPFMTAGYGLPKVVLAPLFIVWFGIGVGSKIGVVAISAFFVVYANSIAGVRSVDSKLSTSARILGATDRDILLRIILPGAMPFVLTGIRTATPYSVGSAVLAELLSANRGLGYLMNFHATSFDTAGVVSTLAIVGMIVGGLNQLVNSLERRWVRVRYV